MRKFLTVLLMLSCGIFATALSAQIAERQPVILNLYVSPIEGPDAELAKSIRGKLIDDLAKHGIALAESKENADAILTGSKLMQNSFPTKLGHRSILHIHATMRLVNKNGVALLAEDISSSRFAVSESASFVDRVTDKVLAVLAEESKRRNSEPVAETVKKL